MTAAPWMWTRVALVAATVFMGCARYPVALPPAPAPGAVRPPADFVVVVPGADGTVGAVTVSHGNTRQVLDEAYASARIQAGGLDVGRVTPEEVQGVFQDARAALPAAPSLFTVFFKFDRDELTDESQDVVRRLSEELGRRPAPEVVVVGHTDRVGTVPYNDALSLQRAARVRTLLIAAGIAESRIQIAGRGEREPIVPTEDEVAEPRNRRVEITVR